METALEKLRAMDTWHVEASLQITAEVRSLTFVVPVLYAGDFYAPDRLEGTVSTQILGLTRKRDVTILANTIEVVDGGSSGATASVTPTTNVLDAGFHWPEAWQPVDAGARGAGDAARDAGLPRAGQGESEELNIVQEEVNLKLLGELTFDAWIGV